MGCRDHVENELYRSLVEGHGTTETRSSANTDHLCWVGICSSFAFRESKSTMLVSSLSMLLKHTKSLLLCKARAMESLLHKGRNAIL